MSNRKKPKKPKTRNWVALQAYQRSGAGQHKDKKDAQDKYDRKDWKLDLD